ncbi:hypothetical protein BSLA_01f1907 [Burkholderia stabilis]|nr:hypothetical protein BSLA_01f1907 [Burkholderia stabilis]
MAAAGRANAKRAVFYPNAIPGKRQSGAIDRFFDSAVAVIAVFATGIVSIAAADATMRCAVDGLWRGRRNLTVGARQK